MLHYLFTLDQTHGPHPFLEAFGDKSVLTTESFKAILTKTTFVNYGPDLHKTPNPPGLELISLVFKPLIPKTSFIQAGHNHQTAFNTQFNMTGLQILQKDIGLYALSANGKLHLPIHYIPTINDLLIYFMNNRHAGRLSEMYLDIYTRFAKIHERVSSTSEYMTFKRIYNVLLGCYNGDKGTLTHMIISGQLDQHLNTVHLEAREFLGILIAYHYHCVEIVNRPGEVWENHLKQNTYLLETSIKQLDKLFKAKQHSE